MFKNLNPALLGISGRQSEIIELALTYGFRGLDLDLKEIAKRARSQGVDQAVRFIRSAKIQIGGVELPVRWRSDETVYKEELQALDELAGIANQAKVYCCTTCVLPESDELPYHENFERHRLRLAEIAQVLARHDVQLAVGFHAAPGRRVGRRFQFIQDANALAALLKSVPTGHVGLWLDTWDWYVGGGSVESLRAFGVERIAYVTIADAPANADRSSLTEDQRLLPSEEGAARVSETLGLLNRSAYRGPITLAPHPECFTGMQRDAIVRQCSQVLDGLMKATEAAKTLAPSGAAR